VLEELDAATGGFARSECKMITAILYFTSISSGLLFVAYLKAIRRKGMNPYLNELNRFNWAALLSLLNTRYPPTGTRTFSDSPCLDRRMNVLFSPWARGRCL
jgi:hypothetical protein